MASIDRLIMGCEKCPATLVEHGWMPISFFGDSENANAWTISINPSGREFTDGRGIELSGSKQRFARVSDCNCCVTRAEAAQRHSSHILKMQRTIFQRVPYRNYFSRLGRFLLLVHGQDPSKVDPLLPFAEGVIGSGTNRFRYSHVDIVKCATRQPWSGLVGSERELLASNCMPYLEEQIEASRAVGLILVNGQTTYNECLRSLARLGFDPVVTRVPLGSFNTSIASGTLRVGRRAVKVVAWSANVVNQRLTTPNVEALAHAVRVAVEDSGRPKP